MSVLPRRRNRALAVPAFPIAARAGTAAPPGAAPFRENFLDAEPTCRATAAG